MFNGKAPVYFVFHDPAEKYYQESMLCLGFEQYITLVLHKNGYKNVLFLNAANGGEYIFRAYDRDSYKKSDYPAVFKSRLWEDWQPGTEMISVKATGRQVAKWLVQRMGEDDTAVVTDAATLRPLMNENEGQYKELCERFQNFNASGTILLTAPMRLQENDLVEIVRLFRENSRLFPEFTEMLSEDNGQIFEKLRVQLPDRIIELGDISPEELRIILRNVEFRSSVDIEKTDFEDFVTYLHYWLRSSKLRKDGFLQALKAPFRRSDLYLKLMNAENRKMLKANIDYKKNMNNQKFLPVALRLEFGGNDALQGETVSIEQGGLRKISQMDYPKAAGSANSTFCIHVPEEKAWVEMQRDILKPREEWPDKGWLQHMQCMYSIWEWACANSDYDTRDRAITVLYCCIQKLYVHEDDSLVDKALKYLEISKKYKILSVNIRNYGNDRSKLAEANHLIDESNLKSMRDLLKEYDAVFTPKVEISSDDISRLISEFDGLSEKGCSDMEQSEYEQKSVEQVRSVNLLDEFI